MSVRAGRPAHGVRRAQRVPCAAPRREEGGRSPSIARRRRRCAAVRVDRARCHTASANAAPIDHLAAGRAVDARSGRRRRLVLGRFRRPPRDEARALALIALDPLTRRSPRRCSRRGWRAASWPSRTAHTTREARGLCRRREHAVEAGGESAAVGPPRRAVDDHPGSRPPGRSSGRSPAPMTKFRRKVEFVRRISSGIGGRRTGRSQSIRTGATPLTPAVAHQAGRRSHRSAPPHSSCSTSRREPGCCRGRGDTCGDRTRALRPLCARSPWGVAAPPPPRPCPRRSAGRR